MRKRLSSKLLAVILTVAICATTVFGCLMTVNAADSCYSFSSVEVSDDLTEATIGVTFKAPASLPNGFIAGAFSINEVDADAADKLTIKSVSGSGVSVEIEGNNVVFNTDAAKSILAFELTFGFSKGTATKGKDYKIQLSGIELAYNDIEYYEESAPGAIGKISTECEHVIGVVGEPLKVDTANNYTVYENSVCTLCGEKFGIQLVPGSDVVIDDGTTITWSAEGAYDSTLADNGETGAVDSPIIINSVEELYYLAAKAGVAEHAFGDDNKCDTCEWECTNHVWVDDGEPVELGMEATKDACKKVAQKCEICGIKGEDRVIAHTTGEWETPWMDMNKVYACTGEGQHTEVLICTECFFEVDRKIVIDPKTGHSFVEYEEEDATCSMTGTVAHKQCEVCWNNFTMDAADDEAYENALETIDIPVNPENHKWEEMGAEADCENEGVVAHKYCTECNAILMGEEQIDVEINWDEYYKYDDDGNPVGPGAILDSTYGMVENEALAEFVAENYADAGIEVPEYPAADATEEEMNEYYAEYDAVFAALAELDENFYTAWDEYWSPLWSDIQTATRYLYVVGLVAEDGVDFVVPAKGHTLVKVDEVAATYDKEGTKAHYACECGKLYSDAEGKNEVTAESLVIARLVKEDKPAGDGSTTSPVTGESVASVAAVAALVGAAFVLVRKSKKA